VAKRKVNDALNTRSGPDTVRPIAGEPPYWGGGACISGTGQVDRPIQGAHSDGLRSDGRYRKWSRDIPDHVLETLTCPRQPRRTGVHSHLSIRHQNSHDDVDAPGRCLNPQPDSHLHRDSRAGMGYLNPLPDSHLHRDSLAEMGCLNPRPDSSEMDGLSSRPDSRLNWDNYAEAVALVRPESWIWRRGDYELALELREKGKIRHPGGPFEESDTKELDMLFDTGVLWHEPYWFNCPLSSEKFPQGTILHVMKPLYGIPEAGAHWFATYQVHHLNNLGMETSTYVSG
jgi:hypothetical protein